GVGAVEEAARVGGACHAADIGACSWCAKADADLSASFGSTLVGHSACKDETAVAIAAIDIAFVGVDLEPHARMAERCARKAVARAVAGDARLLNAERFGGRVRCSDCHGWRPLLASCAQEQRCMSQY